MQYASGSEMLLMNTLANVCEFQEQLYKDRAGKVLPPKLLMRNLSLVLTDMKRLLKQEVAEEVLLLLPPLPVQDQFRVV